MVIIRPYQEIDREDVRRVCIETSSKHYTKTQKGCECMCWMFVDYYMDYEPENVFVAVDDGKVCGYIVCSTNSALYKEKMRSEYAKKIRKNCWHLSVFTKICVGVSTKLDAKFGGGFHINLDKEHQFGGYGPKLLTVMGLHLQSIGINNMYLVTRNKKTRGYPFYRHFGFEEKQKYFLGSIALVYNLCDIENKRIKYLLNETLSSFKFKTQSNG